MTRPYSFFTFEPLVAAQGLFIGIAAVAIFTVHFKHGLLLGLLYYVGFSIVLSSLLRQPRSGWIWQQFKKLLPWLALMLIVAIADQLHMPKSQHSPTPLTSSFALEMPAKLLAHGHDPYSAVLPLGAPVSPGPGWIVLWSPLTIPGYTGLLVMSSFALATWQISKRGHFTAGLFFFLVALSPIFESQAANGQDLYAVSLWIVILCILAERFSGHDVPMAFVGALAGVVATSRIPIVAVLCVLGLGLCKKERRSGTVFIVAMVGVCMTLHMVFAILSHHNGHAYPPMHILSRAGHDTGLAGRALGIMVAVAGFAFAVTQTSAALETWLLNMCMLMCCLFIPEALKELRSEHFRLAWEGSSYITFPMPLLAAAIALREGQQYSGSVFEKDTAHTFVLP